MMDFRKETIEATPTAHFSTGQVALNPDPPTAAVLDLFAADFTGRQMLEVNDLPSDTLVFGWVADRQAPLHMRQPRATPRLEPALTTNFIVILNDAGERVIHEWDVAPLPIKLES